MKKQVQPLTPAALYARVSSDRQDVDLSVSAQGAGRPPGAQHIGVVDAVAAGHG